MQQPLNLLTFPQEWKDTLMFMPTQEPPRLIQYSPPDYSTSNISLERGAREDEAEEEVV